MLLSPWLGIMSKVIVFGSTGAIGRSIVAKLMDEESVEKVTAVSRSEILEEDFMDKFPDISDPSLFPKLEIMVVDYENLKETLGDISGYDSCVIALGTTRSDAGGVEGFSFFFFHLSFPFLFPSLGLGSGGWTWTM